MDEDSECILLGGERNKLMCSMCVVEGCSLSIEAKNEDIGVAS